MERILRDFSGNKSTGTRETETGQCTKFTEHLLSVLVCADAGREIRVRTQPFPPGNSV